MVRRCAVTLPARSVPGSSCRASSSSNRIPRRGAGTGSSKEPRSDGHDHADRGQPWTKRSRRSAAPGQHPECRRGAPDERLLDDGKDTGSCRIRHKRESRTCPVSAFPAGNHGVRLSVRTPGLADKRGAARHGLFVGQALTRPRTHALVTTGSSSFAVVRAAGSGPASDISWVRANGGVEDQSFSTPGDESDKAAADEPAF